MKGIILAGGSGTRALRSSSSPTLFRSVVGDLMLAGVVGGPALLAAAGLGWAVGQLPRLRGRRGLHLPDPVGRWSAALGLSVIASWVLYLAYILLVARLATSYSSNWLISYGGWLAAQLMALVAVVILVKLVGRIWLVRGHHRTTDRKSA